MNEVTQDPDDSNRNGPHDREKMRLQLPSRDSISLLQTSNLLNILGSAVTQIRLLGADDDDEPKSHRHDGGVRAALEAVAIKAASRLEDLLDDSQRWTFNMQESLEKKLEDLYAAQQKMVETQTAAIEQTTKPHMRYNPSMVTLTDGRVLVYLGDPDKLHLAITGIGDTAAAALAAFDEAFSKLSIEEIQRRIKDQGASDEKVD